MEYPFWKPDFNRASNYEDTHPEALTIFNFPNSIWLTGRPRFKRVVDRSIKRTLARAFPSLPVFVLYAIPNRDLGQHSAGGLSALEYLSFCERVAKGIGDSSPILIFEPDALAHVHEMDGGEAADRLDLIVEALDVLRKSKARIYVDIGHSNWLDPVSASDLLTLVEIEKCAGFSINVSNFRETSEAHRWGDSICSMLYSSDSRYVIDTSRNGNGPIEKVWEPVVSSWCNPPDRALGTPATCNTGNKNCDAYLWVKIPGESDGQEMSIGETRKQPKAGRFYPDYAVELVRNSGLGNWGNYK